VRWLLAWRPTSLAAHRVRLLIVVVTLACMLVNEVARLQLCYLASYAVPCFEGTCSVHIDWRKNDTAERALHRTRPLEGPNARHRGTATDVVAGRLAGSSPGLRQADPAGGVLQSMPSVVHAHEVRAGRHHGGHGSTVLPSAGERLDSLGRRASGGRLHSLLWHLRAEGQHLSSDRGSRPAHICPSRRPIASVKRLKPTASDWLA
jgi:hypothetical protein